MAKKKKIADDKYLLEEFSFKTTFKKEKKMKTMKISD